MTNEEAKIIIGNIPVCGDENYSIAEYQEAKAMAISALSVPEREKGTKDCRDCVEWKTCPCGEEGHTKGTSIGYSIGECKDFKSADREKETDGTLVYNADGHFYGVMGGDAIMERMRGKE